ncbi:MAG: hypothetical protein RID91_02855, partial [Azospirillaceae bacterium]
MDTLMPTDSRFLPGVFAGGSDATTACRGADRLRALFEGLGVREAAERDRLAERFVAECLAEGESAAAAPARAERALDAWFARLVGVSPEAASPAEQAAAARRA